MDTNSIPEETYLQEDFEGYIVDLEVYEDEILLGSLYGLLFFIVPLLLLCFFGDTEINTELRKSNNTNKIELPKWDDPNMKETLEATLFPKIQSS